MAGLEYVRCIAVGSAVDAWLVRDGTTHFHVQISRPELARDVMTGDFLERSYRSVSAPHPEVLSPVDVSRTGEGRYFFRSAPITGWTAADLLRRTRSLNEGLVLEWSIAVCEALTHLHARGQVHGCLAPRHLHLKGTGDWPAVQLCDTTLLHFRGERSLETPSVLVEPEYLSPERAGGMRGTASCDVWGVGALVIELLSGRPPFRGESPEASRLLARHARPPKPSAAFARWKRVLEATLAPAPMDRIGSALELRQELLALV
ncbi:MAG: protein kinase [Myxococcaceae bacterium]